jgi:hypothetical protein
MAINSIVRWMLTTICVIMGGGVWMMNAVSKRALALRDWLMAGKDYLEEDCMNWLIRYTNETKEEDSIVEDGVGVNRRFVRHVAREAYFQFGVRDYNKANRLVTRKWIRNLLTDKYKDLRTCDKITVIDEALFLSFVPSDTYAKYEEFTGTSAWKDHVPEGTCPSK